MATYTPGQIYVPGTYVSQPELFVGRTNELNDAAFALEMPGMNLVVHGHRGLGKTTFVHHATFEREDDVIFLDCGSTYTLETFIGRVFNKLGIDQITTTKDATRNLSGGLGGRATILQVSGNLDRRSSTRRTEFPDALYSADFFCDQLKQLRRPTILVLDEFDALRRSPGYNNICAFLVEVMKACARRAGNKDNLVFKLIIVGVGTSVSDLIGEHGSIERNLIEIEIGKIANEQIEHFLRLAEHYTGFNFDPSVRIHFIEQADGYPFFIHKLGLECCTGAKRRQKQAIYWDIYEDAFDVCYKQIARSYASRYKKNDLRMTPPEKAVLLGVCLENAPAVTLTHIHAKYLQQYEFSLDDLQKAAERLVRDKLYLFRIRATNRFGFLDPIMKVFFRERYFLNMNDLSQRRMKDRAQRLKDRVGRQSDLFDEL